MLNFKAPTIEDRLWAQPILSSSGQLGCDCNFTTLFLWQHEYNIRICHYKDFVLRANEYDGKIVRYAFPVGNGDINDALSVVFEDAKERGIKPNFMLTEKMMMQLEEFIPNKYSYEEMRESNDYIYLASDLSELAGKKYHAKRNHISKFMRLYQWEYKELNKNNLKDAMQVAKIWCKQYNSTDTESFEGLSNEYCAIKTAAKYFEELNIVGGILYIEGNPVAMTMASPISNECLDVHFEKAIPDIDGAYTMINNALAKNVSGYKYFNREEDLGLEGLRKAKLSYYPEFLLQKYKAIYHD
ncbi:MAG: phosphatidylglycerol lysyltransferase domain-containing protein [Bacillota bacterium]|nr:phosphatidylglycerol lysyltransferase domain-containing protein [Bacillota bacterium]